MSDDLVAPWEVFDLDDAQLLVQHEMLRAAITAASAPPTAALVELREVIDEEMRARSTSFAFLSKLAATRAPDITRGSSPSGADCAEMSDAHETTSSRHELPPPPSWYVPDACDTEADDKCTPPPTEAATSNVASAVRHRGLWDNSGSSSSSPSESSTPVGRRAAPRRRPRGGSDADERKRIKRIFAPDGYFNSVAPHLRRRKTLPEKPQQPPRRKPPLPHFHHRVPKAGPPLPRRPESVQPLSSRSALVAVTATGGGHGEADRSATPAAMVSTQMRMPAPAPAEENATPDAALAAPPSWLAESDDEGPDSSPPATTLDEQEPGDGVPAPACISQGIAGDARGDSGSPSDRSNNHSAPSNGTSRAESPPQLAHEAASGAPAMSSSALAFDLLVDSGGLTGIGVDPASDRPPSKVSKDEGSELFWREELCDAVNTAATTITAGDAPACAPVLNAVGVPLPSTQPLPDCNDQAPVSFAAHFNDLSDFLVEPTRMTSLRGQPPPVLRQALQKLRELVLQWQAAAAGLAAVDESGSAATRLDAAAAAAAASWYKVQLSRPEVLDLVTSVMEERRAPVWEEVAEDMPLWNLWWSWRKPRPREPIWLAVQVVNHIPGSSQLTRKDLLKTNIQRYSRSKQRGAGSPFNIMPQTFTLPAEYVAFAACFAESKGLWIMKTVGMSRGRGIKIIAAIDDIVYCDKVVVQQYIERPSLIEGHKFDLRLYVLVTQFSPLECFISHRGFARLSSMRYTCDPAKLGEKAIHLTNTSVSTESKGGRGSASAATVDRHDTKWALDAVAAYFERCERGCWARIWEDVCAVVMRALACAEDGIRAAPCTFELFGFDVILDSSRRPFVLEVNASPAMDIDGPVDEAVKPALLDDIISLIDPLHVDKDALLRLITEWLRLLDPASVSRFMSPSSRQQLLDTHMTQVLKGRMPRKYGELPQVMGAFQRLAPSPLYDKVVRQKRAV